MNEREKLKKEVMKICVVCQPDAITDFILSDRQRIVEPLVKLIKSKDEFQWHVTRTKKAIEETLKRAGIESEGEQ